MGSNKRSSKKVTMKKYLFIVYLLVVGLSSMAAVSAINEKMVQSFNESYPHAVRVKWLEFPETYAVNFEEAGVKSTIHYNKDGSFLSAVRYYSEEKLPYYLIASLKEKFPGKKIYCVTELSNPYEITYYIKLEDAKTWRTVKADSDGNFVVIEKFNKAS
jgi:hypothetical protein